MIFADVAVIVVVVIIVMMFEFSIAVGIINADFNVVGMVFAVPLFV